MNTRHLALLAAFSTAIIYGVSYTVAKNLMPTYIPPFALIFFRVFGAGSLFWICSLFLKKERIDRKDFPRILLGAIFGASFNMLCFFKGLNYTAPIAASAIGVMTPIMVFLFSIILLKEKKRPLKILGIFIGFVGALALITHKNELEPSENAFFGNFLVFLNATFYGLYLIISKKLLAKYHPIHVIKWMYLIGVFLVLPFSFQELRTIQWELFSETAYFHLFFIVVFTTFFNYLFNLFALTKLKPTTVGAFVYLHPVFASFYAVFVGSDVLSMVKVVATFLIFIGVFLVSKPNPEKGKIFKR
jgi:drug/metabolite transporter (DMT)-like permease